MASHFMVSGTLRLGSRNSVLRTSYSVLGRVNQGSQVGGELGWGIELSMPRVSGARFAGCGSVRVSDWATLLANAPLETIRWIRSPCSFVNFKTLPNVHAPSPGLALFCSETQKRYYAQLYNDSISATSSHNSQPDPGEASLTRRNPTAKCLCKENASLSTGEPGDKKGVGK